MSHSIQEGATPAPALAVRGPLTEDLDRPLAVLDPHLSWYLQGEGADRRQTGYRIVVTDEATGAIAWDSGEVASDAQSRLPYAGPELAPARPYSWTVAVRDETGTWSEPSDPGRFVTGLRDHEWEAAWIRPRADEPGIDDDVYWFAERVAALGHAPIASATLHAAAAHDYELSVNGRRIGRGQSFDYPGETRYQGWDVTDEVREGGADVALRLHARWYGNGQGRAAGVIGLIARLTVTYADGTTRAVVTDGDWTVADSAWSGSILRNCEGDFVEECDGRLGDGPIAGTERPAHVIGAHPTAPLTRLVPELTPVVEEPAVPRSLTVLDDGTTVLDFGEVIPARLHVDFTAGVAGRTVELTAAYSLEEDGHVATSVPATQETDMRFLYTQRDGEQTYTSLDHLGFRYLQVPDVGEPMTLDKVRATVVHAGAPRGREATFASSDPMLDAVVDLMIRSARLGAQNQFVDTPTREKGQFLQDAVNISEATMAVFRERELTRKAIRQSLDSQDRYWLDGDDEGRYNAVYPNGDGKRDIPDFSINMIAWVWDLYAESGDKELLQAAYPYLVRTARYIARAIPDAGPTAGLVTDLGGGKGPYEHGIVDWPAPGRFGYDMDTAVRTTVNALSVRAFATLAHIAGALGDDAARAGYDKQASALAAAINDRLLTDDGYVDGLTADGERSGHLSQHATSYAIAYGIAPAARVAELTARIADQGMRQGPMTVHILVEALMRGGRPDAALRLLTDPDDLGWAKLVADGHSFTWEQWQPGQSESHAWGATAVVTILERFLGIRVDEPGAAHVRIQPETTVLQRVEGTVHTERGPVSVRREGTGAQCRVEVAIPPNMRATIALPRADQAAATRLVEVGSGRHTFAVASRDDAPVTIQ